MLEFLIAATDDTDFTFDARALATAATTSWPGATVTEPTVRVARVTELFIELPDPESTYPTELAVDPTRRGLGLDASSYPAAARVLAWLAQVADLPTDGSVVVIHWTDDFYPLRPGVSVETLLQDAQD